MSFFVADGLPVRLIDLAGTLAKRGAICFTEPVGWGFHVISHTWSQDLRMWSSQIGKLQRRAARTRRRGEAALFSCGAANNYSSCSSDLYNQLFEGADFSKHNAYNLFVKFLQVLRADGVERAWFDALCINQEDTEEKSREIKNMGPYYSLSLGCYVWAHGVGQGYSLWDSREESMGSGGVQVKMGLPRWFSRVWTFQELLLPKNLMFVVELDFNERQMLVNAGTCFETYSLMGHDITYCCPESVGDSIIETSRTRAVQNAGNSCSRNMQEIGCADHNQLPVVAEVEADAGSLVKAVFVCEKCGCQVANSRQVGRHALMCLVEREAYMDLMNRRAQLASRSQNIDRKDVEVILRLELLVRRAHGDLDDLAILRMHGIQLGAAAPAPTTTSSPAMSFQPQVVLGEIGERQCSEGHDEDRVLSVLALLCVEEVAPVRAGKTLGYQILELANALLRSGNEKLLLQLCSAPLVSDHMNLPGMSWIPPFKVPSFLLNRDRESFLEIDANTSFQPIAHLQMCTSHGLTLSCYIINAKVSLHCLDPPLYSFQLYRSCATNTTYLLGSMLYSSDQLYLTPSSQNSDFIGSLLLQAKNIRSICESSQFSFHVRLLLLATIENEVDVFMVCVGKTVNRLHKIGTIAIPTVSEGNDMYQTKMIRCIVGGFRKHLPKCYLKNANH